MGLFDTLKRSIGLQPLELEFKLEPGSAHVDGELRGELIASALKPVEIFSLEVELMHSFPDEYGHRRTERFDGGAVVEMLSLTAQERQAYPFFIGLPAEVAPTMGAFSWALHASARLKGASDVRIEQPLTVSFSPIMAALIEIARAQFGFAYASSGADEECLWVEMAPQGAVQQMYRSLEIAFDERDRELTLWISLDPFSSLVLDRYRSAYDPHENTIEIEIDKGQYVSGHAVDHDALLNLIKPLFTR